jgi:sulfopyruvate decarboxylase TPP-binding subunit
MEQNKLKKWINSHNFIVGVPCSKFKDLIDYEKTIITTTEEEAIGIAVGAKLMGKNPLVFIQNSGLGRCIDIITSLLQPYNIKIDLLISIRHKPEHHRYMGKITKKLLKLLNYINYKFIEEK